MITKNQIEEIFYRIETQRPVLFSLLQDLIRIRSYSGEEKNIVEFIILKMKDHLFDEAYVDKFGNAVGRIGNGPVKILYDAHVDTVIVTENENWIHPPFEGKITGGKIFGRGAVDEKPAMAGFLIAAGLIRDLFKKLPFTLYVVGSVMEEDCDGYPLLHLIREEGIRPDHVLLGEPTDLFVYRGQRGRMEMDIVTTGVSAHGAHNQKGINAIYKMMPLIGEIEKLDQNLPEIPPLGKGSLTVSQITSQAPSLCSVADHCRIHIDRRLTEGESMESAKAELQSIAHRLKLEAEIQVSTYQGISWTGYKFSQEAYFPTWMTNEAHPLVRAGMEAAGLSGARADRSGFWQFSTNGVATAGRLGIPTIGFAPGREELAHTSKEELILEDLVTATRFYCLLPFILADMLQ